MMNTYIVELTNGEAKLIECEKVKVYRNDDIMFYNEHSKWETREVIAFYQADEYKSCILK